MAVCHAFTGTDPTSERSGTGTPPRKLTDGTWGGLRSVCVSVCLPACEPVCSPAFLPVCMRVCVLACLPACLP
eukprot:14969778-Alexandrium_andersonii.AAC.1